MSFDRKVFPEISFESRLRQEMSFSEQSFGHPLCYPPSNPLSLPWQPFGRASSIWTTYTRTTRRRRRLCRHFCRRISRRCRRLRCRQHNNWFNSRTTLTNTLRKYFQRIHRKRRPKVATNRFKVTKICRKKWKQYSQKTNSSSAPNSMSRRPTTTNRCRTTTGGLVCRRRTWGVVWCVTHSKRCAICRELKSFWIKTF